MATSSSTPPLPLPPEPSPPPPPPPRPPEPSPPSYVFLHFLDEDSALQLGHPQLEGPSLMMHMVISSLSAVAMLVLACSLRTQQRVIRHRPRPAVAHATPIYGTVYGMVPGHDDAEDAPVDVNPAALPGAEEGPNMSSTIELEVIASSSWSPRARCSTTVTAEPISTSVPVVIAERIGEAQPPEVQSLAGGRTQTATAPGTSINQ